MIDTIKFAIPVTDTIIDSIRSIGFETSTTDKFYGFKSNEKVSDIILLPPYNNHLTLLSSKYDPYIYYLEGSLPKQYYGENVHLLYPSQLEPLLKTIYSTLLKRYGYFVSYEYWTVQRLDICYAWKYKDQANASRILDYLKTLDYPRKNKLIYKTSVIFSAKAYSIKFYLKKPEFIKNKDVKAYETLKKGFPKEADEAFGIMLLYRKS